MTPLAWIAVGFEANDDYAIGKLRLHYRIDKVDNNKERMIGLDTGGTPKSLRGWYKWELAKLSPPVPEESLIEWWLEAEDTNDATGPGKAASEHYQARIVSVEAKRAELMARTGDMTNTLQDLTANQETLNQKLGKMVVEKAVTPRP